MHPGPIIVHQMGKVGSKTVELSLRKAYEALGIQVPIYHTHILNGFERVRGYVLKEKNRQDSAGHFATLDHGESVRKLIDENPAQHWNIISLVRDPIARNVSAFFESLPEYIPDWHERYAQGTLTAYEVQALFLKSHAAYEKPDFWFDSQVKSIPAFGIDVYATPFPHNVGYKIYPGEAQASLLLIRLENLKECSETAMQEFLGLENFSLYNTNTTNEKGFAELYRRFNELPLPVEYVEERYNTRFAQHFYSDAELDTFIERWTKSAEIANSATYRNKQFAEMEKSVRTLAVQVVEKTQALRALTAQVVSLEKRNAELSEIKASKVWELAIFLRRLQIRVAPPNGLIPKVARRFNNYIVSPFLRIFKKQNIESDLALLRSSDLFDAAWYLTNNQDVVKTHMDPVYHYLLHGGFQGRDPSPNFSSGWYLEKYEDVKKAKVNPLVHYLRNGKNEGREPRPQQI
jgi:hypothetical protein